MDPGRASGFAEAFQAFAHDEPLALDVVDLFRRTASTGPAYQKFLAERGIDPAAVTTVAGVKHRYTRG
jgi:phenylacetate-CoA ligase